MNLRYPLVQVVIEANATEVPLNEVAKELVEIVVVEDHGKL